MDYLEAVLKIIEENKEMEAIGALTRSAMTKKNIADLEATENRNRLYKINQYNSEHIHDEAIGKLSVASKVSL